MNKKGSISILDDKQHEMILRELIVLYDEKHNTNSKVLFKDIYEFVKSKYENKEVSFYPSYTWWKTKGKFLVEEYNMVKKKSIQLVGREQLDIVIIMDVIEKYYGNKDALIKYLSPINDIIDRFAERINKLEDTLEKASKSLYEKEKLIKQYKEIIKKQEDLIDSLFYYNIGSESKLKKIIEIGKTDSDIINCSLSETFNNPSEYIKRFIECAKEQINNSVDIKDNIVQFNKKNKIKNDTYDW